MRKEENALNRDDTRKAAKKALRPRFLAMEKLRKEDESGLKLLQYIMSEKIFKPSEQIVNIDISAQEYPRSNTYKKHLLETFS